LKAETEEEFRMLAKRNPVTGEAYCRLQVMSEDEANRMLYEARLKAQRDEYSCVHGAWQEGLEKAARPLKALGDPVEKTAQATGLSADKIAAL
jgi:hypothetical protein